ncbi:MAG: 3-deoxy-7-phosphoheptulonate synthase [Bacteriovoracaceae bacterium]
MSMKNKLFILGPCSLESFEQISQVANILRKHDVTYIRTQLFKPRTRPESFQGLGVEGLQVLAKLRETYSVEELKFVAEVCSEEQLAAIADDVQVIQIGARNMQNFELLKVIGKYLKKQDFVLLKRGFANTLEEWLASAEYLQRFGVPKNKIVLCERGSRTLTSPTGVHLDFIVAMVAKQSGYQVIIDPSHGTKKREFVLPLAAAALAMDFDGVMIECHPEPAKSVSDAAQAISLEEAEQFLLDNTTNM